jgi:hypothetical protein
MLGFDCDLPPGQPINPNARGVMANMAKEDPVKVRLNFPNVAGCLMDGFPSLFGIIVVIIPP